MRSNATLIISSIIAGFIVLGAAAPVGADEARAKCPICSRANNPNTPYLQKSAATFLRGVMNTMFGWTELLVEPVDEVVEGGDVLKGIGKGIGSSVTRTGKGIGEMLTFWIPKGKGSSPPLITTCPLSRSRSSEGGSS